MSRSCLDSHFEVGVTVTLRVIPSIKNTHVWNTACTHNKQACSFPSFVLQHAPTTGHIKASLVEKIPRIGWRNANKILTTMAVSTPAKCTMVRVKYLTMWLKRWRGVVAYFSTKNDKTNRGNSVFDLFVGMFVFVLCVWASLFSLFEFYISLPPTRYSKH